ncbi:hypothetical protein I302_104939 [Kwoniella bestiolae CBS 10118]|uniref:U3 small nucleolar RNA-associated protein 8 n=1 Tax=Kwoniella bestiolae CBS 10118 TaxID=1296100 RepID=A0A1B9FRB6_9TREE|nr:hypothetical protein I302_08991 [Kwoniella bestiolae CBS 10118]OCF21317.1 hypothetical protein I302_08991 [Kwoniella bestiolae CBS 10118]
MASISTPTQLATFSQPHASSSKTPHVTLSPVVGDSKCAVAAVRGDGIWTYDLNTLRPTTSFTVPPSTVFSTSPISYWVTQTERAPKDQSQGVVEVSEDDMDVDAEEDEDEEETVEVRERTTLVGVGKEVWRWVGEEGDKEVIEIGQPIKSIHHLPSSLYPILVISSSPTDLHLLNDSFIPTHLPLSLSSTAVLTSKILSPKENSARLVIVDSEGKVTIFQLTLEDNPRVSRVSEGKIGGVGKLGCVDISDDGVISALDQSNNLYTLELSSLSSPSPPLTLVHPSSSPVILSLPTSGKPLILLPTSHPTPSLLLSIPLSTLPAILSSTSISSFTSSGTVEHLAILSSKNGILTVGVVLSHLNSDGQSGRSVIYTTEVVIPPKGIGMGSLLGTKEKTQIYLMNPTSTPEEKKSGSGTAEQDGLIKKICELIKKNQLGAAESALKEYLSKAASAQVSEGFVRKIVNVVFTEALNDEGKLKGNYAAGVVGVLVERGLVNDSLWKSSLVGEGLLPCGDWNTIILCLQRFRTISSLTLVKLISSSLHPSHTDKNVPALSHLLSSIMASPPAPTFRLDLRQNLSVEDATSVLAQFASWAEEHVKHRGEGLKGWDSESDSSGIQNESTDIPSLNSLITYSSLLLDSHLPLFLSHEASHELLESLNESLIPLMEVQNEYKKLRGPIEAILILAKREEMKAQETLGKSRGDKKGGEKGTRIPEERIGKWKVEDLVF